MKQISDEQLLASFRAGDNEAFSQLLRRYEKQLFNFLVKFLGQPASAEDVFQEVFLQVHLSADTFQSHRRFRPWVYTIAANKARDFLRSRARRPAMQLTGNDEDADYGQLWGNLVRDETTPDEIFSQKQQEKLVRAVVAQLPDHLREILVLAYFQKFSYKEMAEVLDIPLGTVKSRLHAAVGQFGRLYKAVDSEET